MIIENLIQSLDAQNGYYDHVAAQYFAANQKKYKTKFASIANKDVNYELTFQKIYALNYYVYMNAPRVVLGTEDFTHTKLLETIADHTLNLTLLFGDYEKIIAYLKIRAQSSPPNTHPLAINQIGPFCNAIKVAAQGSNFRTWQGLAAKHFSHSHFDKILSVSTKIENYVKANQDAIKKEIESSVMNSYEQRLAGEYRQLREQKQPEEKEAITINISKLNKELQYSLMDEIIQNYPEIKEKVNKLATLTNNTEEYNKHKKELDKLLKEKNKTFPPVQMKLIIERMKNVNRSFEEYIKENYVRNLPEFVLSENLKKEDKLFLDKQIRERLINLSMDDLEKINDKIDNISQTDLAVREQMAADKTKRDHIMATLIKEQDNIPKKNLDFKDDNLDGLNETQKLQNYIATRLQGTDIKKNISNDINLRFKNILSADTSLETFLQYTQNVWYTGCTDRTRNAANVFFQYQKPQEFFDYYISLYPNDDYTEIPDVNLSLPQHPKFYLARLRSDDPRIAVLGEITSCCQNLGESKIVPHIITSQDSGIYALFEKKTLAGSIQPTSDQDKIVAQCWAWRSKENFIVFDSVESQVNFRLKNKAVITQFYTALAQHLINHDHTERVLTGIGQENINYIPDPNELGEKEVTPHDLGLILTTEPANLPLAAEHLNNYDSKVQRIVADKYIPIEFLNKDLKELDDALAKIMQNTGTDKETLVEKFQEILRDFPNTLTFNIGQRTLAANGLYRIQIANNRNLILAAVALLDSEARIVIDNDRDPVLIHAENFHRWDLFEYLIKKSQTENYSFPFKKEMFAKLRLREIETYLQGKNANAQFLLLYAVRGIIIHSFQSLTPSIDETLKQLDSSTLEYILKILYSPKVNQEDVKENLPALLQLNKSDYLFILSTLSKLERNNVNLQQYNLLSMLIDNRSDAHTPIAETIIDCYQTIPIIFEHKEFMQRIKNPEDFKSFTRFINKVLDHPIYSQEYFLTVDNLETLLQIPDNTLREMKKLLSYISYNNPNLLTPETRKLFSDNAQDAAQYLKVATLLYTTNIKLLRDEIFNFFITKEHLHNNDFLTVVLTSPGVNTLCRDPPLLSIHDLYQLYLEIDNRAALIEILNPDGLTALKQGLITLTQLKRCSTQDELDNISAVISLPARKALQEGLFRADQILSLPSDLANQLVSPEGHEVLKTQLINSIDLSLDTASLAPKMHAAIKQVKQQNIENEKRQFDNQLVESIISKIANTESKEIPNKIEEELDYLDAIADFQLRNSVDHSVTSTPQELLERKILILNKAMSIIEPTVINQKSKKDITALKNILLDLIKSYLELPLTLEAIEKLRTVLSSEWQFLKLSKNKITKEMKKYPAINRNNLFKDSASAFKLATKLIDKKEKELHSILRQENRPAESKRR